MRRTAAIVGGLGLLVIVGWWLWPANAPVEGLHAGRVRATTGTSMPGLVGAAGAGTAPPAARPGEGYEGAAALLAEGPCSIAGTVVRGRVPVRAQVEVRRLGGGRGTPRELMRPLFAQGPPVATASSAEDGTFVIARLPADTYDVRVRTEDGAWGWERARCRTSEPVSRVWVSVVGGPDVIEARAVHADGRAFRGWVSASVGGDTAVRGVLPDVRTDAEGRFLIEGVPAGPLSLRFIVPDVSGLVISGLEVPLAPGTVFIVDEGFTSVEGRVLADDSQDVVPGAALAWSSEGPGARLYFGATTSDADGIVRVVLAGATATLDIAAEGFLPADVEVEAGQPLSVRLVRTGRVVGRVLTKADDRGVADVPVHGWNWYLRGMKSPLATSDAQGRYEAGAGPGRGMIYAFGGGWASEALSHLVDRSVNALYVDVGSGATTECDLVVVPTGRVEGVVLDSDGAPIAGLPVGLDLPAGWSGFQVTLSHGALCTTITDAEGRFVIEHLIPGFPYTVVSKPTRGLPGRSAEFTSAAGQAIRVEIRLPADRWLPVEVREEGTGRPIAGVAVQAVQAGRHEVGAATGADGSARIGPLLPGPLTLRVQHADYLPLLGQRGTDQGRRLPDPGPAPERLVVELERGAFVAGVILDAGGEPVGAGQVGLHPVGQRVGFSLGLAGQRRLSTDGAFRLGPVAPGRYDLVLVEPLASLRYRQVSRWGVTSGQEDLRLRIDPAQTDRDEDQIVLAFVGPDGKPASAHVRVFDAVRVHDPGMFLSEGRLVESGIEPGTVAWIEVRGAKDAGGAPLADAVLGPVTLGPGTLQTALSAAPSLTGRVTGPDGAPVVGLLLQTGVLGPPDLLPEATLFAAPSVRTDGAGRFTLPAGASGTRLFLDMPADLALRPPLDVAPGSGNVEIRLEPGREVDVRVHGPRESTVAGARVTVSIAGTPLRRTATTDEDGVARLGGLSPTTPYVLEVEPPAGTGDLVQHVVEPWLADTTTVVLRAGRTVEGRVVDGEGAAPHATVWWRDDGGRWCREATDAAGRFRFTAGAAGTITLAASAGFATRPEAAGPSLDVAPGARDVVLAVSR